MVRRGRGPDLRRARRDLRRALPRDALHRRPVGQRQDDAAQHDLGHPAARTRARVCVEGTRPLEPARRTRSPTSACNTIGFVFQDYHLFPRLTTVENVAIPLILKRREWSDAHARGDAVPRRRRPRRRAPKLPPDAAERRRAAARRDRARHRERAGHHHLRRADGVARRRHGAEDRRVREARASSTTQRCIVVVTHDDRIYEYADRILHMEDGRHRSTSKGARPMRNKIIFALGRARRRSARSASAYVYAVPSKPLAAGLQPGAQPVRAGHLRERDRRELPVERREHQPLPRGRRDRSRASSSPRARRVDAGRRRSSPIDDIDAARDRRAAEGAGRGRAGPARRAARAAAQGDPRGRARAGGDGAARSLKSAGGRSSTSSSARTSSLPESVSKDALDNAINARKVAQANLDVVTRQYELTKAGAWVYDVRNQEKQAEALREGVRRVERAARQVHDPGARPTASSCRSTRRSAATSRRRAPTTRTRRASAPSS